MQDPDEWRFRQYAEGNTNESPVDLSGREGAPPSNCKECSDPLDKEDFDRFDLCKECREFQAMSKRRLCEVCDKELEAGNPYSICPPCVTDLRAALADTAIARVLRG